MAKKSGVEKRGGVSRRKLYTRLYCILAYKVRYLGTYLTIVARSGSLVLGAPALRLLERALACI